MDRRIPFTRSPRSDALRGAPERRRRLPRIALLLALVLLIPVTSLAAVTGSSAVSNWAERHSAAVVRADVSAPTALTAARTLVVDEGLPSIALSNATESRIGAAQLARLSGVDFSGDMRRARPLVDANPVIREYPILRANLAKLHRLRQSIDAGIADYHSILAFFTNFTADVDTIWTRQLDKLRRDVTASSRRTGVLAERISVLPTAYALLTTAVRRGATANDLLRDPHSLTVLQSLIKANGAYGADAAVISDHLGPQSTAAWQALQRDPAVGRFEAVLDQTVDLTLAGRRSPLALDMAAHAHAFSDGARWLHDLQAVVHGASSDVGAIARREELAASRNFQLAVATFLLSVLFAAAAARLLTRSVVRPLSRLAGTARHVAEGDFTPPIVPPSGPREVADTILAVDDMTAVLAAVEAFTVTLAQDPTAASLDAPLPGRTGLALQTTLDRLRESVRDAERQRLRLYEVATHDGLTGLLNRTAALDEVHGKINRSNREAPARARDTGVTVLFIDLDGLKAINDTHGHKVGDDAIRLAAQALRGAAASSDLVARLGGDEFLVADGCGRSHDEVQALADRLHRAVAECSLTADLLSVPLRCSIGTASSEAGDDVESLVHKADQALYAAKREGRDRTCWYRPSTPAARQPV